MLGINFTCKKSHPDAVIPTRATEYDAGYDLYALEEGVIIPNNKSIIKTGISIRMPVLPKPFKVYGSIRSRSGLSAKHNLEVGAGVIDRGYIKDLGVILYNHSFKTYYYKKGDRIAQLILEVHIAPDIYEVKEFDVLSNNDRNGGFGSTGN